MKNESAPRCCRAPDRGAPGSFRGRVRAARHAALSYGAATVLSLGFDQVGICICATGIPAGLYGKLVGASDYQLNLHPPEEDTQDVLDSLDSVMAVSMRWVGFSALAV